MFREIYDADPKLFNKCPECGEDWDYSFEDYDDVLPISEDMLQVEQKCGCDNCEHKWKRYKTFVESSYDIVPMAIDQYGNLVEREQFWSDDEDDSESFWKEKNEDKSKFWSAAMKSRGRKNGRR
ncbi:MAG: hypothetical protein IJT54_04450 [Candidatus Methanomethylophilaceae archaeon]|nr:hypothetical protein [Candidatus Methanomethylophilaceae archaeon]